MYKKLLFTTTVATLLCYWSADARATQRPNDQLKQCYDGCRKSFEAHLKEARDKVTRINALVIKKFAMDTIQRENPSSTETSPDKMISAEQIQAAMKDATKTYAYAMRWADFDKDLTTAIKGWEGKPWGSLYLALTTVSDEVMFDQGQAVSDFWKTMGESEACLQGCYKRFVKGTPTQP